MTEKSSKDGIDRESGNPAAPSTKTRSGNPNATDPNEESDVPANSGYGGEMGEPRTSSDQPENADQHDS